VIAKGVAAALGSVLAALCLHAGALEAGPPQKSDSDESGRNLAAACTTCHAGRGAGQTVIPSLDAMPAATLIRSMQDFRAGIRPSTVMQQLARGYTDEDVARIAAWFAARKAGGPSNP